MNERTIIQNTDVVKKDANTLASNAVKLDSVKHSIEYALNESKQSWEQSQADASQFTQELEKDIQYLEQIITCNKEFAAAIENYMIATNQTSTKTI